MSGVADPAAGAPRQESALLRRTRRRLIAWSAGSTLVVLLVLGVAIYWAASTSLASAGVAQLQRRLDELQVAAATSPSFTIKGPVGVVNDPGLPGFVLGGASSGTIAFMVSTGPGPATGGVGTGGVAVERPLPGIPAGFVDAAAVLAEIDAGPVVRETTIGDAPVRVMAAKMPAGPNEMIAVVIGDRSAEVDTLRTLLVVLLGGGLAVLAAAVALGYLYAGRALVPIRDSLRRQREFAADASHELRTPLTITRAAIAELRRGRTDPATVERALDDLDAGATRIERLVDDLLLLARTDADAIELIEADTDLALAAAEATEGFEAVAASRGVRLALDVSPAPLRGDEARLRQLVAILLDNAIRHSPAGGRVTVAVHPGARLVVEDEGPGIAPEDLDKVFDRFWRATGAPTGGTGLGLAIARWIAERHGGSIRAEARAAGTGARFVVDLPGA
jgi:signal transduction histidine kinase